MLCMVRVERRGKSPPVPQVTGGSCKLYPKQHRKENSAPGRRAGPVRFREVARGVWQQASQIDGCIDRTRLIGLLEKRRHPQWMPSFLSVSTKWQKPLCRVVARGCMHAFGAHLPLDRCKKLRTGRSFLRIDRGRAKIPLTQQGFSTDCLFFHEKGIPSLRLDALIGRDSTT